METLIFNIARGSLHDGAGIRTVVFVKGCTLNCAWCHNPEGINPQKQTLFYPQKCIGCRRCDGGQECPAEARVVCGEEKSPREVLESVQRDIRYYQKSGGGVTVSGGECLSRHNIDFTGEFLRLCRENGINTAVESAFHVPYDCIEAAMPYVDTFLVDIKLMDSALHKKHTGADNHLILENIRRLFAIENPLFSIWIRTPLIPDITDTEENLNAIEKFLLPHRDKICRIERLPYNNFGEGKRQALLQ